LALSDKEEIMAGKKEAASLISIEELKKELNISDAVFEGVKAANKWKSGRQVEKDVFQKACDNFRVSPVDGRKDTNKEAKG